MDVGGGLEREGVRRKGGMEGSRRKKYVGIWSGHTCI